MLHHKQDYNFNQRGEDTIHDVTMTKCQKYPSKLILKHANVLDQVIKLHNVYLYNITPYKKFTVLKSMYAQ